MRNLKTVLPMLAFILAIGMSFAFVGATEENYYVTKYILTDNGWESIDVNCTNGDDQCTVTFEDDPLEVEYPVFDQRDTEFPTDGTGEVIQLPGDVPGS